MPSAQLSNGGAALGDAYLFGNGGDLWRSAGTAGTTALLVDLEPGAGPAAFAAMGSAVYFTAFSVASGREASAVLLDEAQPSAFVCASDTLAMGVLHTLAERGLRPGHDIAVTGFDDSQVARSSRPA